MNQHLPSAVGKLSTPPGRVLLDARRQPYVPAVGPRLRWLLALIFASVAVLGASGVYLSAVRLLEWLRGLTVTNQFTMWMFLVHVVVGVLMIGPFFFFGLAHYFGARHRPNRLAVRLGLLLFLTGIIVCLTGLALVQIEGVIQLPTETLTRQIVLWLHILTPLVAVILYVLHRRAGPDIRWSWGLAWGAVVGVFCLVMLVMHSHDPRKWYAKGPAEGEKYFEPSKTRTIDGNFIPAAALMMDHYCMKCHQDIYNDWFHSAHHFSSFNNPPYRFSVRETRQVALQNEGNTRRSRWCAGCHDIVPFLSGAFDDPNFDDVNHPTAHAGITCTSCHAITHINSTIGNGDYTIGEPLHYPFAYSENPLLQWLNNQVVKAKPDFHKKTFLKPFHRTAEFCGVCHKVGLPIEVTHYKEFLRGQNHYDTYLLSGVSGHGARSFYYPPEAKANCAECHMPLKPSRDFGSRDFDGSGVRKVHDHSFPAANTGLPYLLINDPRYQDHAAGFRKLIQAHTDFLRGTDPDGKDKKLRIDIFGLKEGGTIDGKLHAPLRPNLPKLKPGATYLVEVVLRTLNMGHPFPQGTADSNEIWVDFLAQSGDRVIGRSGALYGPDETGRVDEWSHFVNVHMLDRNGNRINRRNPQDIFVPLYDHQIPPGAAQVVHYVLKVPADVREPVRLQVRLRYRKFDFEYLTLVYEGEKNVPKLPIVDICEDELMLAVEGGPEVPSQQSPIKPAWQRWNDYGIGCFLEGGLGSKKGELRQAEEAFKHLLTLPDKEAHAHGHLNLARVYFDEGRLEEAVQALRKAEENDPPAPWWTVAWFRGLVNAQNGHLDEAIRSFELILDPKHQPWNRKFDFTKDFVVINELAATLFRRSQQEDEVAERDRFLRQAVARYEETLTIEPEDLDAHYGLSQCFARLGERPLQGVQTTAPLSTDDHVLLAEATKVANQQLDRAERIKTAVWLAESLVKYAEIPSSPERQKLPTLLALIAKCRPVYDENDVTLRVAVARLLGRIYRQTHLIYKPDDNARDRTVRLYRAKNPAADHASQAIVLYPLNRPGAPGF